MQLLLLHVYLKKWYTCCIQWHWCVLFQALDRFYEAVMQGILRHFNFDGIYLFIFFNWIRLYNGQINKYIYMYNNIHFCIFQWWSVFWWPVQALWKISSSRTSLKRQWDKTAKFFWRTDPNSWWCTPHLDTNILSKVRVPQSSFHLLK